jgi:hypothetical protein
MLGWMDAHTHTHTQTHTHSHTHTQTHSVLHDASIHCLKVENGETESKETDGVSDSVSDGDSEGADGSGKKSEYVDGWELVQEICEMWEMECPSNNVQRTFIHAVDHVRRKRDKKIATLEESLQQKEGEVSYPFNPNFPILHHHHHHHQSHVSYLLTDLIKDGRSQRRVGWIERTT